MLHIFRKVLLTTRLDDYSCKLIYGDASSIKNINKARKQLFAKKERFIETLPPTHHVSVLGRTS